jgi:hypothetical protein
MILTVIRKFRKRGCENHTCMVKLKNSVPLLRSFKCCCYSSATHQAVLLDRQVRRICLNLTQSRIFHVVKIRLATNKTDKTFNLGFELGKIHFETMTIVVDVVFGGKPGWKHYFHTVRGTKVIKMFFPFEIVVATIVYIYFENDVRAPVRQLTKIKEKHTFSRGSLVCMCMYTNEYI